MENEQVIKQEEEEQVVEQMATEEAEAAQEEVAQEGEVKQEVKEEAAEEQTAQEGETNGEGDAPKEVKEGDLIKASTDNELKLFIGGLPRDTTSAHMKEYFSTFGKVSLFK